MSVSAFQFKCREPPSSSKPVQGVVDFTEEKGILFCDVIQSSLVYAEAKAPVFHPDEHHGC
jgi:hypothetical protein